MKALAALVAAALAAAASGGAQAAERTLRIAAGHEVIAFVPVPMENVRPFLPPGWESRYTLRPDRAGNAQLVVHTHRFEGITLDGRPIGTDISAAVAVVIEAPAWSDAVDDPDLTECCNWYLLDWSSANPSFLGWLRGGPLPVPAGSSPQLTHVDRLHHGFTPAAGVAAEPCPAPVPFGFGGTYGFTAPAPAPSPFVLTAVATMPWTSFDDRVPELSRNSYWIDTPGGVVRLVSTSCLAIGVASGTVAAAAGSDLWRMFGGVPRPFAGVFSSNWVLDGGYTKFFVTKETS